LGLDQLLAQRHAAKQLGNDELVRFIERAIDRHLSNAAPEASIPLQRSTAISPDPRKG
jgi:hypothetical protein